MQGSGVFGLSTAIHLAERGYSNVTVLDRQSYDVTLYDTYFHKVGDIVAACT